MNDNKFNYLIKKNLNTKKLKKNNFFDKTINEIISETSNSIMEIINDISILPKTFKDINASKDNWIHIVTHYFKELIIIFTKNDRLIHVSILLFFLSIFFYFIKISE